MPLRLEFVMFKCNVSMAALGREIPKPGGSGTYSKATIFKVLKTGETPSREKPEDFRRKVEKFFIENVSIGYYFDENNQPLHHISNLWDMLDEHGNMINLDAAESCDPEAIGKEAELLSQKAMERWKLDTNPFERDIRNQSDIHFSEEARFMFHAMKSAATSQGLMAISGSVGAGKTTAIKWLVSQLNIAGDISIVRPRSLDKSKISEKALADAIMQDVAGHNAASGPEKRARQLERVLIDKHRAGNKTVLLIDEAHLLTPKAILLLKALYEIEDGFDKTIGIVLIGQLELEAQLLNNILHPELEPFIARCHITRIKGLDGCIKEYLAHKFTRVKMNLHKVITPGGIEEMESRLVITKDGKTRSIAFPLIVNNLMVKAMNEAARLGEDKVDAKVVRSLGA